MKTSVLRDDGRAKERGVRGLQIFLSSQLDHKKRVAAVLRGVLVATATTYYLKKTGNISSVTINWTNDRGGVPRDVQKQIGNAVYQRCAEDRD